MSSQLQSTVLNGPSDSNQAAQNMVKPVSSTSPEQIRPPLHRIDSRTNFSPRGTGFPPQQFRPQLSSQQQQHQQHRPPFIGTPQYPRPQLQRNPSSGLANIRPGTPNPAAHGALRQPSPFSRPTISPAGRPPGFFPQKSVPAGAEKPQEVTRSRTLDSTDSVPEGNAMENPHVASKILEEEVEVNRDQEKNEINKKLSDENLRDVGRIREEPKVIKQQPEEQVKNKEERFDQIPLKQENVERIDKPFEKDQRSPTPEKVRDEPKVKVETKVLDENPPQNINKSPEPPKSPTEKRETIEKKPEKPKTLRPDSRNSPRRTELLKSPTRSEGDNDSGVDESTQGNDQSSNGDHNSPRKSSGKTTVRNTASPTKSRSASRGSKSPLVKTPDSPTPSTPGSVDKKKVPMNKVQVGGAPSPNLKEVRSKIGSLQNTSYKPGGGQVKIESKKIDLTKAQSKIEAKNDKYVPGGGEKKIEHRKLNWSASSKVGSLDNSTYKPKGGDKKIETIKLDFKDKAKAKVGSKDNIKHQPGGGDVKIETKKIDIKAKSKIKSLDNVKHKPGGGDKKIFDDKDYLRQKSGTSGDHNSFNGSQPASPVKEYYSPEVNIISPTQEKVTVLKTAEVMTKTEISKERNKPPSKLTRTSSLRIKKAATPRSDNPHKAPWRF